MRCPACAEQNSDKAVVCELCQAPLRGLDTAGSVRREQAPTPAGPMRTPVAPKLAPPSEPAAAMPKQGVSPGSRPAVFHIPQPSGKRGPGALSVLLVLALLGGGVAAAYRYWPRPAAPKTAPAPVGKVAIPVELPPTERPAPPAPTFEPVLAPAPSPTKTAPVPNQPIVEVKPAEPRGTRSVSSSWLEGADGLGRAKKEQEYANVPLIIYFRVDWCPYCRRMDQDIITSSSVSQFLANVVKVRINPESSPPDREVARSMGVKSYPSVYVVPRPGATPEKIPSLSRKANEPIDLSAEKFISAAKQAGIRQAHNQVVDGWGKLERGDTAGARADLDRAIEMNPQNAEAYFWRGEAEAKAGELGKAVGNFKRALELQPERKDALFALANIYGRNREYDEAITYLTRAIRVDPDYAHGTAFAQRGYNYQMKGDLDAAKADFAEACKRGTTGACAQAQP
jgi:thioredoxin-like negative regulator of GroEL